MSKLQIRQIIPLRACKWIAINFHRIILKTERNWFFKIMREWSTKKNLRLIDSQLLSYGQRNSWVHLFELIEQINRSRSRFLDQLWPKLSLSWPKPKVSHYFHDIGSHFWLAALKFLAIQNLRDPNVAPRPQGYKYGPLLCCFFLYVQC